MNGTIIRANKIGLEKGASALKAIAHPTRIAIISLLRDEGRLSVKEIHTQLDIEQAVASHHLGTLKSKGVLSSNREGNRTFYFLRDDEVVLVLEYIEQCFGYPKV